MELDDKVIQIVSETIGCDVSRIGRSTALVADLGVDSAGALLLLVALEDAFDITLSDRAAAHMRTVGDIVDHLKGVVKKA